MLLEQLKKLMPEGTSDTDLQAKLEIINADAKALVDSETKGLKDNKEKLLTQMAKLKETQVPDDLDLEGYKKFLVEKDEFTKKQKELEDAELEGKGQWEALKIKLSEAHSNSFNTFKNEKETEINGLKTALEKELIENNAIKAIEKEKGNSFFLLPHMKNQIATVKDEAGNFSLQVIGADGKQRMSDDQTKPFSINDLVAEMKANPVFVLAFPEMNSGGGGDVNAGTGGAGGVNPWKAETKNVTEQGRLNKSNPTLAAQYKKAAGVS